MKFIVIGITDHPRPFFPPDVAEVIQRGTVFSGGKRHHDIVAPFLPAGAQWINITVPVDAVFEQYRKVDGKHIVVFASGDPLFFGFANTIMRKMPEAEVVVFPTFNSLQMLSHRLLLPCHSMRTVSLTGRPWHEFDRALIEGETMIGVLTDREHTPAAIAQRMMDYGYTNYRIHVGEHLGNPETEKVSTMALDEAAKRDFSNPNCVILCCDEAMAKPFGIPDTDFALLDGREKMITKMPIRLLTLSSLDLPRRHVLWDIGFCTGSISIESRLRFPHLHVVAFEVRPECQQIIEENARRHGTPGIETVIGDFRSVNCDKLPAPDAVFIGGHGGHLDEIMAKVLNFMAPDGVIVMNSVSFPAGGEARIPSKQLWDQACHRLNLRQHTPLRIQLNDHNPIEILKAQSHR